MKLITKDLLHADFQFQSRPSIDESNSFVELKFNSKQRLITDIGRAKNYLIKEKKFQKGDKVLLATTLWPDFLVWFFSVLELGGSFVVSDSPGPYYKILQKRLDLYGGIDHLIWKESTDEQIFTGDLFGISKEKFIDEKVYIKYEYSKYASELILAEETDIVMYSTSSGTTDTPKIAKHNHLFFYDLLHRNGDLFELKDNDRCLHTKNLHHGSVLGVYLLPTLKFCKYHFWQPLEINGNISEPMFEIFKKYKINRCLFYNQEYLRVFSRYCRTNALDNSIDIFLLSAFSQELTDYLVGKCGHRFTSIFGCTETSGPLFLHKKNKNNYQEPSIVYSKTLPETVELAPQDYIAQINFGRPLDDFYNIQIEQGLLTVIMPSGEKILTGDRFKIDEGEYWFLGRKSGMRIKNYAIYTDLLAEVIEQFLVEQNFKHGVNFDLTIDSINNRIYMRSDQNIDLGKLNLHIEETLKTDAYTISYLLVECRDSFIYGIKFDSEKLRFICRQALDLSIS